MAEMRWGNRLNWRDLLWATILTGIAIGLTALAVELLLTEGVWGHFRIAKAGTYAEYCELNRMGELVRQPMNSWSNFIYFFFAMLVLRHRKANLSSGQWISSFSNFSCLMTFAFILLCFGSFFFHASLTRIGQRLDMTGTYGLVMTLIIGLAFRLGEGRWWENSRRARVRTLRIAAVGFILFFLVKWMLPGKLTLPLMILIVAILAVALLRKHGRNVSTKLLLLGVLTMVLAAVFRVVDLDKIGCGPESWFQFHALWHGFTGMSGFVFYLFLGSGKKV